MAVLPVSKKAAIGTEFSLLVVRTVRSSDAGNLGERGALTQSTLKATGLSEL